MSYVLGATTVMGGKGGEPIVISEAPRRPDFMQMQDQLREAAAKRDAAARATPVGQAATLMHLAVMAAVAFWVVKRIVKKA